MVTVQSTTVRTVTAKSGMLLPATIDQFTDFNLITTGTGCTDYKQSGCLGSFDTRDQSCRCDGARSASGGCRHVCRAWTAGRMRGEPLAEQHQPSRRMRRSLPSATAHCGGSGPRSAPIGRTPATELTTPDDALTDAEVQA